MHLGIFITILIIPSLFVAVGGMITVRQFVYQRDMSEYCRRRVMPSVFIGRHVVQASAQILHFSQLEVPYSCFISIRTESGGNIILAMKLKEDEAKLICRRSEESPVKVYEMGETFGGYWGNLPDSILAGTMITKEHYETLKTDPPDASDIENPRHSDEDSDEVEVHSRPKPAPVTGNTRDTQEYVTFQIPLVNVSGGLVTSDKVYTGESGRYAQLDAFDRFYEVNMPPGRATSTTIFPLVQLTVDKSKGFSRRIGVDIDEDGDEDRATAPDGEGIIETTTERRYQLDFTIDPRLSFLFQDDKGLWPAKRYPALTNKRLNFKKPYARRPHFFEPKKSTTKMQKEASKNDSWSLIEAFLSNLTMNESEKLRQDSSEQQRFSALMQRLSDWQHNYSAYLAPNLTLENPLFVKSTTLHKGLDRYYSKEKYSGSKDFESAEDDDDNDEDEENSNDETKKTTTTRIINEGNVRENVKSTESTTAIDPFEYSTRQTIIEVTTDLTTKLTTAVTTTVQSITSFTSNVTQNIQNYASKFADTVQSGLNSVKEKYVPAESTSSTKPVNLPSPTSITAEIPNVKKTTNPNLMSHASWENVVQVAPEIADILKDTTIDTKSPKTHKVRKTRKRGRRKKRYISAIQMANAQPHNLTTVSDVIPTSESMYSFLDMHDFAQLVELQDDEILGHVALRYMRRYVGSTILDMCSEYNENQTNLVFLFNTSRIVLALTNFTLRRMTVVLTPARLMTVPGQRCSDNDLECQVAGARVCVSQLVACDDVPNCGAEDIYDEDRLMCGIGRKIQHNVYLAAFTFLAVLLTILYTVHYWLKRCVPKVSEAFFIYTNGTENLLYLESVMRSPLENDAFGDMSKLMLSTDLDELGLIHINQTPKKQTLFRKIFGRCLKKKEKSYVDLEMVDLDLDFHGKEKKFSFPELEISNLQRATPILMDSAAQTGQSLELQLSQDMNQPAGMFKFDRKRQESIDPRAGMRDIRVIPHASILQTSQDSELQVMKFFRDKRLSNNEVSIGRPIVDVGSPITPGREGFETEIRSTVYGESPETGSLTSPLSMDLPPILFQSVVDRSPYDYSPIRNVPSVVSPSRFGSTSKKLRFDENLTTIPPKARSAHKREDDKSKPEDPESLEPEPSYSGRDFRRFWQSKPRDKDKSKKPKKKTQLSLYH